MLPVLIKDSVRSVCSVCNYALTSLTEFAVLVHLCINLPNNDLVKAETCRRAISENYYLSLIVQLTYLLHGAESFLRS